VTCDRSSTPIEVVGLAVRPVADVHHDVLVIDPLERVGALEVLGANPVSGWKNVGNNKLIIIIV